MVGGRSRLRARDAVYRRDLDLGREMMEGRVDPYSEEFLRRQEQFQGRLMDDGAYGFNAAYSLASRHDDFRKCGKNVRIHTTAVIPDTRKLELGDNVRIDAYAVLSASKIVIGDFVHIGAYSHISGPGTVTFEDFSQMSHQSMILTATDDFSIPCFAGTTVAKELQALIKGDVRLMRHSVIGAQAIVMPGVTLGFASVLGAKSLAKHDTAPYSIAGGIPAKHIKLREFFGEEELAGLEELCRRSR